MRDQCAKMSTENQFKCNQMIEDAFNDHWLNFAEYLEEICDGLNFKSQGSVYQSPSQKMDESKLGIVN